MPRSLLPIGLVASMVLAATVLPVGMAASTVSFAHAGGGIAFTFTGGLASHTLAAQTLEAHGYRGTFYVSSGLLHQGPYYTAYMSSADVANLSARGHDVESFAVTAPDLTSLGSAQLSSELSDSQAALQTITGKAVRHLAYPYGAVNDAVASAAASRYASGRIISWSVNDFTASGADAMHMPGFLVRQTTSLGEAEYIVNYAAANNVFVVLSFGGIVTNPGAYDWTPADLDALAAYVQSKGMAAPTVAQLVTGAPPPPPPPPPGAGTVVFTIDDGQQNQIAAGKTLADRGMRATYYIISSCTTGEVDVDCMTGAQIKALSAAGHDIEAHTVHHHDLVTLSTAQITAEQRDSQVTLQNLIGKPVLHTAYPYGSHNANVDSITAKYYKSSRIYLTNPDPASLPTLLAQSGSNRMWVPGIGITQATTLARAEQYVDYAKAHNTIIVFAFHDIVDRGSPSFDSFSWSPANFAALADYAKATGVGVKTMAQAYP